MTLQSRPLTELTEQAIQLLYRELGVVDTVRFLQQFTIGLGDYTEERREYYPQEALDNLVEQISDRRSLRHDLEETTSTHDEPYEQRLAKIRATHPRAYEKWTDAEDDELRRQHARGTTVRQLAEMFGRQPGAIESRLRKLGAIR